MKTFNQPWSNNYKSDSIDAEKKYGSLVLFFIYKGAIYSHFFSGSRKRAIGIIGKLLS